MSIPSAPRRWILIAAVALIWIIADQATKAWAYHHLADGHVLNLIWTLRFRLAFNTGSAFSVGAGAGPLMGLGAIVVSGWLIWFSRRFQHPVQLLSVGLVLGGAIGNLLDRIWRDSDGFMGGAVVDFIDLQWWPVFNVADIGIVIGAIILGLSTWQHQSEVAEASQS